jgi:hypothetical protein
MPHFGCWSVRAHSEEPKELLDQGDFSRGQIVYATNHANLFLGYHFRQNWHRVLQPLDVVAHIGDNGSQIIPDCSNAG